MKRAILKAVSVVMVVAMMLCTTIGVYADTISVSQNPADTTLNISGTLDGARPYEDSAVVIIFHKDVTPSEQASLLAQLAAGTLDIAANIGTKILGIEQAEVDANGDFACDVTLEDTTANGTGNYSVVAVPSTTATPVATAAYFVPSANKLAILQSLINAPTQSDIETNKSVFGFDANTNWDLMSAYQNDIARNLATNNAIIAELKESSVTLDDVDDVTLAIAQEIYALALANNVMDPAPTASPAPLADIADMDQYESVTAYENAYDNYTSAAGRSAVDTAVGNPGLSSFAALFTEYKEQILLNSVVNPKDDNGINSRLALDDLASTTGLHADSVTKYNASNTTNRQTVADACKASGATTFAALNTEFINAVAALPAPSPSGTPTPGPILGGGGGGSITTVVQPTPTPSQKPIYERYNDINDYEWAWDAIEVLSNKGIIAGYENGSFAPANSILREEFIKLAVVGLLGADAIDASAVSSFTDAQSGWYAPYIAAAEKSNITSGIGNGLFGTGAQITRQDMALMLYRMLRDASVNGPADAYAFTDADEIADYAAEAVYTLKNMGIINGDPDGSFRPNGQTTRAEAAVLLYKTLDRLGKIVY